MRVNITIPYDVLERIDFEAMQKHLSRSAYIRIACEEKAAADEFIRMRPDIESKMLDLKKALENLSIANPTSPIV